MTTVEQTYTLKDLLKNEYDINKLHAIFSEYNNEGHSPNLRGHLSMWAQNKQHIFAMFGNKLKIEKPVEASITSSLASEMISDFIREHLSTKKTILAKAFLSQMLSTKSIMSNELPSDFSFFRTKFSKGMKISRILGRIVPSSISHQVQTAFSMLIQSFKVQGTAVISIDPVDYITMSTNKSGWRSCHALDGEYRTGTLAYMMDETTAIAYVKTSECRIQSYNHTESKFDNYEFDNKMWRQVVLFSPSHSADKYAIQSRQYPSSSVNNSTAIASILQDVLSSGQGDLLAENFNSFTTDKVSVSEYLYSLVEDAGYGSMWYNDIRHEAFATGRITYSSEYSDADDFKMRASYVPPLVGVDYVPCACGCGSDLEDTDKLFIETEEEEYDEDYYEED